MMVDPITNVPVVLLQDDAGDTTLPITIGMGEASAIATELDHIELERPLSHQLTAAVLAKAGAQVQRVIVHDRIGDTFYSCIEILLADGTLTQQDARSSDALALGLHTGATICVATHIVDCARRDCIAAPPASDASTDYLEGLADDAFGKWKI